MAQSKKTLDGQVGGTNKKAPRRALNYSILGGGPGIRTLGGLSPSSVFKTDAFDRSANPPTRRVCYQLTFSCQSFSSIFC